MSPESSVTYASGSSAKAPAGKLELWLRQRAVALAKAGRTQLQPVTQNHTPKYSVKQPIPSHPMPASEELGGSSYRHLDLRVVIHYHRVETYDSE
jgi:hypothetical protein